jgi:hypothetical protein
MAWEGVQKRLKHQAGEACAARNFTPNILPGSILHASPTTADQSRPSRCDPSRRCHPVAPYELPANDAKMGRMSPAQRVFLTAVVFMSAGSISARAASLYVSDNSLFTVKVFDATSGALTGELAPTGGWGSLSGIAVASDGRVYVADFNNSVVYRFSSNGAFIDTFISSNLAFPTGLAFGPDGYLYVANFGPGNNSYIARLNRTGHQWMPLPSFRVAPVSSIPEPSLLGKIATFTWFVSQKWGIPASEWL